MIASKGTPASNAFIRRVDRLVGQNVRRLRLERGLTQDGIASALGISYQQVQKYESGANRISAGRLFEIARFFGVEVGGDLFEDVEHLPGQPDAIEEAGWSPGQSALHEDFEALGDPDLRAAINGLVKELARSNVR